VTIDRVDCSVDYLSVTWRPYMRGVESLVLPGRTFGPGCFHVARKFSSSNVSEALSWFSLSRRCKM